MLEFLLVKLVISLSSILGYQMHYKKLANSHWKDSKDKVEKKVASWEGNLISTGSRLILVETCLSNVPSFMMSFF
jgi:hypothetical protein